MMLLQGDVLAHVTTIIATRDIIVYCVSNLRPTNQLFVAFVKHGSSHGEGTVRVSVR